jgi:misacylated tRNA(Ala) deacylase
LTRLLFWEDAYIKEFDATVVGLVGNTVELDQTCLFSSSGGQPSDTGELGGVRVVDVRRGAKGELLHVLQSEPTFRLGEIIHGAIDWERRYKIMRLHSACHVMSGVLLKSFDVRKHTGIQISDDKARMDFAMEKLNSEIANAIEKEANRVVRESHDIVAKVVTWDEVNRDAELKTVSADRYERIEVPRILEVTGLDRQLDGGTHVRNTSEIGYIKIIGRENKGKSNKRLVLTVG